MLREDSYAMRLNMKNEMSKFNREEKGSFTIETTLIFPTIFIITIIIIFLSIVIYEKVVVYQKAYVVAERIAFTWDNSKKEIKNGSFAENEYTSMSGMDGLYWRTNQIGIGFIEDVFGTGPTGVRGTKLERAQEEAERVISGSVKDIQVTDVAGFNQKVEVTMEVRLKAPNFLNIVLAGDFEVTASASIKDPVETVRLTEFIFYIGEKIKGYME